MLGRLFLLLLIIPVIEIYLLLKVASLIGVGVTVAILFGIAFIGVWLVRHQGFLILTRIRDEISQGRVPAGETVDGALVLLGGLLLLIPGFFTDVIGIFFLFPPTRRLIKQLFGYWLKRRISRSRTLMRRF